MLKYSIFLQVLFVVGTVSELGDEDEEESSLSFASGVYNVLEDAGTVQICLQLHAPSDGSEAEKRAFVLFSSSNSIQGRDFVPPTITTYGFPSGSDDGEMVCFNCTILDDSTPGMDIFFTVGMVGLNGANLIDPKTTRVNILNDDPANRISFTSSTYSVLESDGTVQLCVELTTLLGPTTTSMTFNGILYSDGTAMTGEDYMRVIDTISFDVGERSGARQCFNITIFDDEELSPEEISFIVRLVPTRTVGVRDPASATVTILNDDVEALDISISCNEASATLTVNQNALTNLGVGPNDYLIINDVVEDDVSEIASDCKLKGDNGGGSLTFTLNQCNPTVENTDDSIYITWYARNAEQDGFKRKNHCHQLVCKYYRKDLITVPPVAVTLTKLELEEISGSGEIPVKLETFSDFSRNTSSRSFVVPQTIYVRASISSAVPNSFFVQIESCYATDPDGIEMYPLINDGVADVSDPDGNVVAPVPPDSDYVPLQQDFQFDSFVWTDDESENAIIIRCCLYLCDSDETGVDCATTMLAPVGPGRRRRDIFDEYKREITSEPVFVTKKH